MKKILGIFLIIVAATLGACSDTEQFRVNGTLEGKPNINLRANYYSGGALRTLVTACRDGEFEFFGSAPNPALLEITDYDHRPLARLIVRNGETYSVAITPGDLYATKVDGGDINPRWSSLLSSSADSLRRNPNGFVARYVAANPADILSTLLLVTEYDAGADAVAADSLMSLIAPEARPSYLTESFNFMLRTLIAETADAPLDTLRYLDRRDSLATFTPAAKHSLIAFSTKSDYRSDSLVPALRRLYKAKRQGGITITDISLDPDTIDFKRGLKADSVAWPAGWLPGGQGNPAVTRLGVPGLPYFIVCDSLGTQLLRTGSAGEAEKFINSLK